ncbi:hypothetical protein ACIOWE_16210 [Pseudomonas sp. NPDC087598]|uniref:hypothetical protein n=1 Tax=Pseudomonas sp. NPDC087598 TaxID=3364440 RepID=UPI00382A7F25
MSSTSVKITIDDLPRPYVLESPTYTLLDPVLVKYSLTIASDAVLEPTDKISVKWQGASGTPAEGSHVTGFVEVGDKRPVELRLAPSLAAINQGKTVTLTYDIIRGNAPAVTSQPLILYVLPVAQGDLPRPTIESAEKEGEGLDLFVRDLQQFILRINAWPLIDQRQFFWARFKGTNADGSVFDQQYWSAPGSQVGMDFFRFGFFAQDFPAGPLRGLKDRSVLTIEFGASLDGSLVETDATDFALRHYIVRTGATPTPLKPEIRSVRDPELQEIPDGQATLATSVTISGTAMAGEQLVVFDGPDPRGTVRAEAGIWQFPLSGLVVGKHTFTAQAMYGDDEVSDPWTITVNPTEGRQLSIEEAPDNANLDPLQATRSLTAVLDYDMQPSDLLSVTVTAAAGTPAAGSHTTTPVAAGTARPRKITLPVPLVAFSIGKNMEVTFTYTRGISEPVTSLPLPLNVLPIALDQLDAPVITQANGSDILDLKDVQSGGNLLFGVWPHISANQRLWLSLEGQRDTGTHNLTMWVGTTNMVHRAWVTNGSYSPLISANYLRQLKDGSKLIIRFRVNLDQVANVNTAVVFQTREYTIRAVP